MGKDAYEKCHGICKPFCDDETNERGPRPLVLATLTILSWRTLLVITKHPKDGPCIAHIDNTTARLITFLLGSASDQERTLPENEVFQEQTMEVTMTC